MAILLKNSSPELTKVITPSPLVSLRSKEQEIRSSEQEGHIYWRTVTVPHV